MIAWWMAQLALLGTLMAIAAHGAEAALVVSRKPTRWAWIAALVMTVVLGALAPTRLATASVADRTWQATASGTTIKSIPETATVLSLVRNAWHNASETLATLMQRSWSAWHDAVPSTIGSWLLIVWAVASVALLALFVGVHLRYRRRRAHWPLGSVNGTTVRIATDTGPAVIGVTNAEIVLPHWLLTRDYREQQLVIAHELEHVRAHDPILLALAQVAVVLLPWHPAVWWMASRLRLAIELDCDRRVLRRGASTRDYGTLLIDLTDHRTGFDVALPAFSCRPSHLERRLIAMTPKRLRYPLIRVLATGAMASLAVLAACEAKLPTSDEMDRMTASSATAAAGRVAMIDTANVVYFVNNVAVSKADADKLGAELIASVNVLQKGAERGGEVRIVTRDDARALAAAIDAARHTIDSAASPTRVTYVRTDADPTRVTFTTPGSTRTVSADSRSLTPGDTFAIGVKHTDERAGVQIVYGDGKPRAGFTGLMIVDGVITDPAAANALAPDQIVSVNVIKGAAATARYSDPRAANGVIQITTKHAVKR